MIQSQVKPITADQFIRDYGDDTRLELIDGEFVEMEPTGLHEQVAAFIGRKINVEIELQQHPYFIPFRCLIKFLGTETAYKQSAIGMGTAAIALTWKYREVWARSLPHPHHDRRSWWHSYERSDAENSRPKTVTSLECCVILCLVLFG